MEEKSKLNYALLSRYRTQLMGIAMLWIILFHIELPKLPGFIQDIKDIGYGGVDIFLFLSGFGLYMSLSKDKDIKNFYKKRVLRIFPAYLLIVVILSVIRLIRKEMEFKIVCLNCLSLSFWLNVPDVGTDWFIQSLIVLYLFAPFYFKMFNKYKNKELFLFVSVCFAFTLCLVTIFLKLNYLLVMLTRVPIYMMGFLLGHYIESRKKLNEANIIFYSIAMVFGIIALLWSNKHLEFYLGTWGLYWYPYILITPPLCLFLAYLLQLLEKKASSIDRGLSFVGKNSLEIFLCHISFMSLFYTKFIKLGQIQSNLIIYNIIAFGVQIMVAMTLKDIQAFIITKINRK